MDALLLGCIVAIVAYCHTRHSMVSLLVCVVVISVSPAEQIEMPFGVKTRMDTMSHVLYGVQIPIGVSE